jgi:predicted ATPase
MIERVWIRNFKSIREVKVDLSPVTVLIGRSGVGKSNFLRAIRFLRNYLINDDAALAAEGGWQRIQPFGEPAPLEFTVRFSIPGYAKSFTYNLGWHAHPRDRNSVTLERESLAHGDTPIFARAGDQWVIWPGDEPAPRRDREIYLNKFPTISEAVLAYTSWTTAIGWHDFPADVFLPSARPPNGLFSSPNVSGQLSGLSDSAENYLSVLREITVDLRDQRPRRQILARIKQINARIGSLELDSITNPSKVVVAHLLGERRIAFDLAQESDGFRRYYAHLLALYQLPPKQVLMFEEPENGIYPGALQNLAEEFRDAAAAGRGQVLLTTQSPDLLDGFAPESFRVVDLDNAQSTRIGPLSSEQLAAVKDHLLEPGELLTVDAARAEATPA